MKRGVLLCLAANLWGSLHAALSPLADPPDWPQLDAYQQTVTRPEFTRRVNELYSPSGGFWKYAQIDDEGVTVFSVQDLTVPLYRLTFARDDESRREVPPFQPHAHPIIPGAAGLLQGRRIALDPGHIGGDWAQIEERSFRLDSDPPIEEAALNVIVCQQLERMLRAAGAEVVWVKNNLEPTTPLRPADLSLEAFAAVFNAGLRSRVLPTWENAFASLEKRERRLFYLTAEIKARAERVKVLQPDLTLCVHFNAAPWKGGQPARTALVPSSRLVVFVHGCYEDAELVYDDQKFALLRKLLEGTATAEERGARAVATALAREFSMPPEIYANWPAVKRVGPSPYVFARNLVASRLYPGPVVFAEGPYMNARDAYERLCAGDYNGERVIAGKKQRSIFREYAEALSQGCLGYFSTN